MSIGIVLRHTYEETCEICEKIANFMKIVGKKWNVFFTRVGYARAHLNLHHRGIMKNESFNVGEG